MMGEENTDKRVDVDMAAANRLPPKGEEFVRMTIRFEYALKEVGYCRSRKNRSVGVCWDEFANKGRRPRFFLLPSKKPVLLPRFLTKPPSEQAIRDGKLDWETDPKKPENVQELFGAVRRVRNNLLDGGKSGDVDHDRNGELVAEAIAVLLKALESHDDLRFAFEGRH